MSPPTLNYPTTPGDANKCYFTYMVSFNFAVMKVIRAAVVQMKRAEKYVKSF